MRLVVVWTALALACSGPASAEGGDHIKPNHSAIAATPAVKILARRPTTGLARFCTYYGGRPTACASCNFWGRCYCSACCVAYQPPWWRSQQ